MIGRSAACSISTPRAFIAMFRIPWTTPKTNRAAVSAASDPAKATGSRKKPSTSAAGIMIRRLPYRSTSRPESCMPVTAPRASPTRAMLSRPSLRPSCSFTAGMRAVQVPMSAP
nr:hypothetical protein [Actinoplanes sp. ATCC 53533]